MKDAAYWLKYAKDNQDKLKIAAFVILIIAIAVPVYFYYRGEKDKEAVNILTAAVNQYNAVDVSYAEVMEPQNRAAVIDNLSASEEEMLEALSEFEKNEFIMKRIYEQKLTAVKSQFENLAANYKGTSSYEQALVYLGHIHYETSDYEKAVDYYNAYLTEFSRPTASGAVLLAKAGALEEAGMDDEALLAYERILKNENYDYLRGPVLFNSGLIYERRGEKEKALDKFKEIEKNEDYGSFLVQQAKERIIFLKTEN